MKVQSAQNVVFSEGAGIEHTAKIKESAKAFHILSGALYSDKILAVVRELSCNAYDAQIDAGNSHIPFEMKIPTEWDNTFYIKDFGTGLSEEQVYSLYMTYFESTKTTSDAFIGQLGLGSKSPFSYGATFNVESRQNGVKKVYTCYKNAELVPAVSLMDTASTDEPNGLTISLSARRDDVVSFQRAAKLATMYFKVCPKFVGIKDFTRHELKYGAEGNGWKMRASNSAYTGVRVVQGAVSYPVNLNMVQENAGVTLSRFITQHLPSFNMDLFVPIGQVDIAPSREALSYDARTSANLAKVLADVESVMIKDLTDYIDGLPTYWDAQVKFSDLLEQAQQYDIPNPRAKMLKHTGSTTYKWHGLNLVCRIPLEETPGLKLDKLVITSVTGTQRRVKKLNIQSQLRFSDNPGWRYNISPSKNCDVIIDDVNNTRLSRSYLMNHLWRGEDTSKHTSAYVISSIDDTPVDQAQVDALLNAMGSPIATLMSKLPVPVKLPSAYKYTAKAKDEMYVWKGVQHAEVRYKPDFIGMKSWASTQIDLSVGGYYIDIDRFSIIDDRIDPIKMDEIIKYSVNMGFIKLDDILIGLNEKRKDYVCNKGTWINLIDHIVAAIEPKKGEWNNAFKAVCITQWSRNTEIVKRFVDNWSPKFDKSLTNNESFQMYIEGFKASSVPVPHVMDALNLVNMIKPLKPINQGQYVYTEQFDKEHTAMMRKNPMLLYVNLGSAFYDNPGIDLIVKALTK